MPLDASVKRAFAVSKCFMWSGVIFGLFLPPLFFILFFISLCIFPDAETDDEDHFIKLAPLVCIGLGLSFIPIVGHVILIGGIIVILRGK